MDYIRSENLGRSTPMSSIWRPTQRISDVYATARHKNNSLEHLWADTLACTRSSLPQRGSTARPAQVSRAGTTRGTCPSRRSAWVRVCAVGVLEASCTVEIDAPRERCYEIAADIQSAPRWQGTLEDVEVLERDEEGRARLVETVTDAMVKKARSVLRFD